jgi:MoaA/NifB/PqqE/SkfB family radical SAM enzyme
MHESFAHPLAFIWDVTYSCPLRCVYCYSESGPGRGPKRTTAELSRIADALAREKPESVHISGGEPAMVPGIPAIARSLRARGARVELYTSGYRLGRERIREIVASVDVVHVSIDSADAAVNDALRGRDGALREALETLAILEEELLARRAAGLEAAKFGIECTLVRANMGGIAALCETVLARAPSLDFALFNAAAPAGRASTMDAAELLDWAERAALRKLVHETLRARLPVSVALVLMDNIELLREREETWQDGVFQIAPDGGVRALKTSKRSLGNIVDEPLATIAARARRWKETSGLVRTLRSATTISEWSAAVRSLDTSVEAPPEHAMGSAS